MKYYNYEDTNVDLTNLPANTHFIVQADSDTLYYVKSGDLTKVYKFVVSTGTETQIDMDSGDLSGDNKSRLENIRGVFPDLDNNLIYFVDSYHLHVAKTTFKACKLDVSTDVCTENGSYTNANGYVMARDIFIWGSDLMVLSNYSNGSSLRLAMLKWVDPNWVVQAGDLSITLGHFWDVSWVFVESATVVYFIEQNETLGDALTGLWKWEKDGTTTKLKGFTAGDYLIASENLRGIASDGTNMYYIVKKFSDSKNYLHITVIGGSTTKLGEYDICLQLDRNTAPGVLEKAFHLTEPRVYQLHPYASYQLFYIANLGSGNVIIAITDDFLINDDGDIFEYVDCFDKLYKVEFVHEIQKASFGTLGVNRGPR